MSETYKCVDSVETFKEDFEKVKRAQEEFAKFSQEKVDEIFKAAAIAANSARIPLAKMAVEETGMGVVEDKIMKNRYAAEYIYNAYKNTKTCGIIEEDKSYGIKKIAEPIGVIAAVIPTTNPTSTAIFKTLISLKTRNGIIISPHPRAKNSTIAAAKVVLEAAVKAGAPEGIISWIDVPSLELTNLLMQSADIILATGGPGMVKSAYSSGKPALGVGAGNVPAVIDESENIQCKVVYKEKGEIKEETGVDVTEKDKLFVVNPFVFSSPGMTDESNAFLCAKIHVENLDELNQDGAVGSEMFNGVEVLNKEQVRAMYLSGRDKTGNFMPLQTWAVMGYFLLMDEQ